jgi:fatty-acyl-CoA synthase
MATGTIMGWPLPKHPVYVYIVPLFHCNGWGHAWAMAAQAGTMVCTRAVTAKAIYDAAADHGAQYFGGAPIVLGMLINASDADKRAFDHTVHAFTAGAPPPPAVLAQVAKLGINVQHVYGLTETYGHVTQCDWKREWDALPEDEQAEIKGRQGPRMAMMEDATAVNLDTRQPIPVDGEAEGEILLRGNTVMKGYFKNPEATAEAFEGGWFKSGDAAAIYPGGYLKIRDRLKDVIISGGENISSVEVEAVLFKYPGVIAAGVVARPDDKWGETPCAFVEMKEGASATEAEIIAFCRDHLAGFKCPKTVVFKELPKTSTGKIQKFLLRKEARAL